MNDRSRSPLAVAGFALSINGRFSAVHRGATRHPEHFQKLMDACFQELLDRRGEGLNPWLEQRFRPFRLVDSKEDAAANLKISPEARSAE